MMDTHDENLQRSVTERHYRWKSVMDAPLPNTYRSDRNIPFILIEPSVLSIPTDTRQRSLTHCMVWLRGCYWTTRHNELKRPLNSLVADRRTYCRFANYRLIMSNSTPPFTSCDCRAINRLLHNKKLEEILRSSLDNFHKQLVVFTNLDMQFWRHVYRDRSKKIQLDDFIDGIFNLNIFL